MSIRRSSRIRAFARAVSACAVAALVLGGNAATAIASPMQAPAITTAHGGLNSVWADGLTPQTTVYLVGASGSVPATTNQLGAVLFSGVAPGTYRLSYTTTADPASNVATAFATSAYGPTGTTGGTARSIEFLQPDSLLTTVPETTRQELYAYITVSDGTKLAARIEFPSNFVRGTQYPILLGFSPYGSAKPFLATYPPGYGTTTMQRPLTPFDSYWTTGGAPHGAGDPNYIVANVDVRGTGCSGGRFAAFDTQWAYDGYDVVQALSQLQLSVQPPVSGQPSTYTASNGRVGMIGNSASGLSQLLVASVSPPALSAVTPSAIVNDTYRSAVQYGVAPHFPFTAWADSFKFIDANQDGLADAVPDNEPGSNQRPWSVPGVDQTICTANQAVRSFSIDTNSWWFQPPASNTSMKRAGSKWLQQTPWEWAKTITKPTMLLTGSRDWFIGTMSAGLMDQLPAGTPKYAEVNDTGHGVNSDGSEGTYRAISAATIDRLKQFFWHYVADPSHGLGFDATTAVRFNTDLVGNNLFNDAARSFALDTNSVAVNPLAPSGLTGTTPKAVTSFGSYQDIPAESYYLSPTGLVDTAPTGTASLSYDHHPAATPMIDPATPQSTWATGPGWQHRPSSEEVYFDSSPMPGSRLILGPGAVRLQVKKPNVSADPTVQVTLSEIRNGKEFFITTGAVRASQSDVDLTNERQPIVSGTGNLVKWASQPVGSWVELNIPLGTANHLVAANARLRLTVSAVGYDQAYWSLNNRAAPEGAEPEINNLQIGTGPVAGSTTVPRLVLGAVTSSQTPSDCNVTSTKPFGGPTEDRSACRDADTDADGVVDPATPSNGDGAAANPCYPDTSSHACLEYGAGYAPVTPTRLGDSRYGTLGSGPFAAIETRTVPIAGAQNSPVPADAVAVVLNVAAVQPTNNGYLTVWPAGADKPGTSALNFKAEGPRSSLVTVPLGADGSISIYNSAGSTHVIVDVQGYYSRFGPEGYVDLALSKEVFNQQISVPAPPAENLATWVSAASAVPPEATSALVTLTASGGTKSGYLTAYTGTRPNTSNLNWAIGEKTTNIAIVTLDTNDAFKLYHSAGTTTIKVDVLGYFVPGAPGRFRPVDVQRVYDSRQDPAGAVGPGAVRTVSGNLGTIVNANATGIAAMFAAVSPTASSSAFAYPSGTAKSPNPNVSFDAGYARAIGYIDSLSPTKQVNIYNAAGSTHYIFDVYGWFGPPG